MTDLEEKIEKKIIRCLIKEGVIEPWGSSYIIHDDWSLKDLEDTLVDSILSTVYKHLEKRIDNMQVDYHYDDGYEAGWSNRGSDIKQLLKDELLTQREKPKE